MSFECKSCGQRGQEEAVVCSHCGHLRHASCTICGFGLAQGDRFCGGCGLDLASIPGFGNSLGLLQAVINTLPHPIYLKYKTGHYMMVNQAMARDHGLTVEDFQGLHTSSLPKRTPEEIESILHADEEVLRTGERHDIGEIEVHLEGGRTAWQHMVKMPLRDADGATYGIVGLAEDITDRVPAELSLVEAKERAEEATRVKDKFVSLVAHDLRSPIGAVLELLRIVDSDSRQDDEPTSSPPVRAIRKHLERMIRMIDDVLEVGRIQSGFMRLEKIEYPASDAIAMAMALKRVAELKGIYLVNEVPDGATVVADPVYFGQVIQNLVSNAIKFCKPGDTVTLFLPEEKIHTIAVRDTGPGVPPEMRENLFRYDVKTSLPGSEDERGSGFGLPLSHDIMAAHGGSLTYESHPGEGTTFYAALPLAENPAPRSTH